MQSTTLGVTQPATFLSAKSSLAQFLHLPHPLLLIGCPFFLDVTWTPFSLLSVLITSYPKLCSKITVLISLSHFLIHPHPAHKCLFLPLLKSSEPSIAQGIKVLYHKFLSLKDLISAVWIIHSKQTSISLSPKYASWVVLPVYPLNQPHPPDPGKKGL